MQLYREADHGQLPEAEPNVYVCVVNKDEYYLEYVEWKAIDDVTEEYMNKVNVVLIG